MSGKMMLTYYFNSVPNTHKEYEAPGFGHCETGGHVVRIVAFLNPPSDGIGQSICHKYFEVNFLEITRRFPLIQYMNISLYGRW